MKTRYILLIFILGLISNGCTKNFEDINENPNDPSTTDPNYIFNYIIKEGAGEYGIVTSYNYTYLQRWVMQTAAVWGNSTMPPYTLFDQYRIQLLWEHYYSGLLLNCKVLEDMTNEDPAAINKLQAARIWKVYNFHKVTDLWGDVPYSEAWELINQYNEKSIKPAYDTQEDIYGSMMDELEDAASKIDEEKEFFPTDMIFNGDLTLWVKFANSLRLRLAIRSGNETVVNEIIAQDNLMSSNEESALFAYISTQDWWNPYYDTWISSKEATPKLSELMFRKLDETNDPRLSIYAQPTEVDNTLIKGVPNLMDANKKENQAMGMGVTSTSYLGTYFTENPNWVKPILTYSEVCFLRAEAAFRGWTGENAQTWYEEGIRSALSYYDVDEAAITEYLTNGDPYNNTLEQILEQKWVALYLDGFEAYAEYRRTGIPQLKKYDLELNGIQIISYEWADVPRNYVPGRLPYPDDEIDFNEANYLKAVEHMGGDDYYQQLWWSEKFGNIDY